MIKDQQTVNKYIWQQE